MHTHTRPTSVKRRVILPQDRNSPMPTRRPRAPRLKQPRPGEEETTIERTRRRQELQRAWRVVSDVRAKKKYTKVPAVGKPSASCQRCQQMPEPKEKRSTLNNPGENHVTYPRNYVTGNYRDAVIPIPALKVPAVGKTLRILFKFKSIVTPTSILDPVAHYLHVGFHLEFGTNAGNSRNAVDTKRHMRLLDCRWWASNPVKPRPTSTYRLVLAAGITHPLFTIYLSCRTPSPEQVHSPPKRKQHRRGKTVPTSSSSGRG